MNSRHEFDNLMELSSARIGNPRLKELFAKGKAMETTDSDRPESECWKYC
jgi:hypothetical protein